MASIKIFLCPRIHIYTIHTIYNLKLYLYICNTYFYIANDVLYSSFTFYNNNAHLNKIRMFNKIQILFYNIPEIWRIFQYYNFLKFSRKF